MPSLDGPIMPRVRILLPFFLLDSNRNSVGTVIGYVFYWLAVILSLVYMKFTEVSQPNLCFLYILLTEHPWSRAVLNFSDTNQQQKNVVEKRPTCLIVRRGHRHWRRRKRQNKRTTSSQRMESGNCHGLKLYFHAEYLSRSRSWK
jgi:hypothetical protein